MNKLKTSEHERFDLLKKTVNDGLAICYVVGAALREIKERGFFKADGHKTFEEFCNAEWGWTRRYCDQLIVSSAAINSLPQPMRKLIASHEAARELSKIDAILRPVIVNQIAATGKPITGAAVKKASPPPPRKQNKQSLPPARKKEKAAPIVLDGTGVEVPKECLALWNRRGDAQEVLSYLSAIRGRIKKAQEEKDLLFYEVDFTDTLAHLNQAYVDMERAKPYAVCPDCQGKLSKDCLGCHGRGFVSEFYWKHAVPEEVRSLRQKVINEGK